MGKQITRDDLREAENVRDRIGKLEEDKREYRNLSEELAEYLRAAKESLVAKDGLLEECAAALRGTFDYFQGPRACGDFTCNCGSCGLCEFRIKNHAVLAKLQGAGIK